MFAPACATDTVSRGELVELKAEVRALREEAARMEKRLERAEQRSSLLGAQPKPSTAPDVSVAADAAPALTVVKLKPKEKPAPPLSLAVPVVEPAPELLSELQAPAKESVDEPDPALGDAEVEAGMTALKTGDVAGGVERLLRFADANPRHPKADNAMYFAGVGLMGLRDYEDAARAFERLLSTHPASDAALEGMLRLAECRVRLNRTVDARAIYEKVVAQFPGTAAATQAQARLASLPAPAGEAEREP